jgi:ABC-type transport system involved in multi-copper enzyme maturation permease subunit
VVAVYWGGYAQYVQESASLIDNQVPPLFILQGLQPAQVVQALLAEPLQRWAFYAIGLVLGALVAGSEYSWATLKTGVAQGPSRVRIFSGQVIAVLILLALLTPLLFMLGLVASVVTTERLHGSLTWPSGWMLLKGMGVAFLLFAMPAAMGLMLATLLRSTAFAIATGLAWLLVVEEAFQLYGFSSAFVTRLTDWLPRSSGDSLSLSLGQWAADLQSQAPPAHDTPLHFIAVLLLYIIAFVAIGAISFSRRDVTE